MAYVDLNSGDAERIRNQYRTSLRRDASDDEVSGWLSGSFGGGSTDDWLRQIDTSNEAQQYKPPAPAPETTPTLGQTPNVSHPQTPTTPYQNLDYWSAHGVPQTSIFNSNTGQLNPGWSRTASGYEQLGGGAQGGDVQGWLQSMLSGASSPQALAALEPQLSQRGIRLQKDSAGNVRGRLYLPDGRTVDVVNQWGQPWTFIDRGHSSGESGGGYSGGVVGGSPVPASQYSDPYTQLMESLVKSRIGSLQNGSPEISKLMNYLQQRFTTLQQPQYTGAENEVIRTGALDPIEQDRSAAKKRVLEHLSARGLNLNSGIAQQALLQVDNAFDAMRATTQTQLAGNELARREGRAQSAEGIAAQLAAIPEARSREAIDYAQLLSNLGPQRLGLAMQAAGMGNTTSGLSSLLSQIAGMNQTAAGMDQNNSNALWSGLGTIAAILSRQRGALGDAGI